MERRAMKTSITSLATLLGTALLAVACSEPTGPGPEHGAPGGPTMAVTAGGGIALDVFNGKLGETTTIWQGFHPTNPHLGDAVVVTFYWIGSTNIITRVYDHLGDGTPVGNAYTPVAYVTDGGISMATYVATNVQNFPEGTYPNDDKSLIVHADLAEPIQDGGITLSAFTGVAAVTADALGAHQSASGSGSSYPTIADPGAVSTDAGALVYGVTMSNGRGVDAPAGFTTITAQTDPTIWNEADYAVQASAGSVDPQWKWYFNAPSTWLASVLVLRPAATQLAFTVQPSTTLPFMTIQPAVQAVALDASGNPTGFNGPVTIAIATNGGLLMAGTLSGTRTVNAVNGVVTFPNLSIDQVGNGYTLGVTSPGLTSAVSAPFNIGPM